MFSLRSAFQALSSPQKLLRMSPVGSVQSSELHSSNSSASSKVGSLWRLPRYDGGTRSIWPNYKESYIHRKYERYVFKRGGPGILTRDYFLILY